MASSKASAPIPVYNIVTERHFEQATDLWSKVMDKQTGAQKRFVENVSGHAASVKNEKLRAEIYGECNVFNSSGAIAF